mmetsp:Transcript_21431/g.81674  ORF Transcript_21431/g.81674 Transcript_21431/m.81674 type:complete len:268 (+) Transcript_21431:484-1287(+)
MNSAPPGERLGTGARSCSSPSSALTSARSAAAWARSAAAPSALEPLPPAPDFPAPPGAALIATMGASANRVDSSAFRMRPVALASRAAASAAGSAPAVAPFLEAFFDPARDSSRSTLFSTTMRFSVVTSAITRHSAVWVWMPLVTSITSSTMSMIWEPPMMVRIRLACPGQSTSVYCTASTCGSRFFRCSGAGSAKAEKPRSIVMPRCRDCGCLSSAAVESTCDRARTRLVLPLSTWPMTPTLMFRARDKSAAMAASKPCGAPGAQG